MLLEDNLTEDQIKLVNSILIAGVRAQQYVVTLQRVANMDVSDEEITSVAVGFILNELDTALKPLALAKSIDLNYFYSQNLSDIKVSFTILIRALINIGENAIQYTEPGGLIMITVLQNEKETSFIIQDEGKGFSKAALQHAKEIFWRQDKSRTGSQNYGVGLYIAEKVAQKHSGKLILENNSQGACVKFIIPI